MTNLQDETAFLIHLYQLKPYFLAVAFTATIFLMELSIHICVVYRYIFVWYIDTYLCGISIHICVVYL